MSSATDVMPSEEKRVTATGHNASALGDARSRQSAASWITPPTHMPAPSWCATVSAISAPRPSRRPAPCTSQAPDASSAPVSVATTIQPRRPCMGANANAATASASAMRTTLASNCIVAAYSPQGNWSIDAAITPAFAMIFTACATASQSAPARSSARLRRS